MTINYPLLEKLGLLAQSATPENLGDVLENIIAARSEINDPETSLIAETLLTEFRGAAAGADEGWKLFANPVLLDRALTDSEIIQLVSVERSLHELCFRCESLNETARKGWGGSSAVRFHMNSIFHYISSMFLVDKSKPSHAGLPMGGTVIRALEPLGLAYLLRRIDACLQRPLEDKTFGDTVLLLRHSHLVHGDFSVEKIEYLIEQTQMRGKEQQIKFTEQIWDLFYEFLFLDLKLKSIFTALPLDFTQIALRYLKAQQK